MNKLILLSIILIQMTSCSFHSSQYDFFKSFVFQENDIKKPKKNWSLYWANKKIDLYAINFEDKIIFANEEINILYKDNQIYMITGLLPMEITLEQDSKNESLKYISDGNIIGIDFCETGKVILIGRSNQEYIRSCYKAKSEEVYVNQVLFNSDGMIIGMRFKIHPDYPSLQLSIK